jgi:tetratricopeptide (TPR) repeat protein
MVKIFLNDGDWNSAIAEYAEAIRLDPNNALNYSNRAYAHYNKNDWNAGVHNPRLASAKGSTGVSVTFL